MVAIVDDRLAGPVLEEPAIAHPARVELRVDATQVRFVLGKHGVGVCLHDRVTGVDVVGEVDDVVTAVLRWGAEVRLLDGGDKGAVLVGDREPVGVGEWSVESQHKHRRPLVAYPLEPSVVVRGEGRKLR